MSDLPSKVNRELPVPTPEILSEMLQLQSKQLDLRARELELRQQEIEIKKQEAQNGYDFAQEALKAQTEDVKTVRKQEARNSKYGLTIAIAVILLIGAVVLYSLNLGKETFVLDLTRLLLASAGGGGVGYIIGHRKASQRQETVEE